MFPLVSVTAACSGLNAFWRMSSACFSSRSASAKRPSSASSTPRLFRLSARSGWSGASRLPDLDRASMQRLGLVAPPLGAQRLGDVAQALRRDRVGRAQAWRREGRALRRSRAGPRACGPARAARSPDCWRGGPPRIASRSSPATSAPAKVASAAAKSPHWPGDPGLAQPLPLRARSLAQRRPPEQGQRRAAAAAASGAQWLRRGLP